MKRKINKYRISTGAIYEYDEKSNAYVCIGKTIQYTKKQLHKMNAETIEIGEDD